MAQDARVRYTKMMTQNSFIQLVKEKPFSKITLKEVCKLSGINHSTFYRHYKDVFDWKEQTETAALEHLKEFMDSLDSHDIREVLFAQLEYYQANKDLYEMMASDNFESAILQRFTTLMLENAETTLIRVLSSDPVGVEKWNCYDAIYGIEGVIRCWVTDGMVEATEEVAEYIISHVIKHFND